MLMLSVMGPVSGQTTTEAGGSTAAGSANRAQGLELAEATAIPNHNVELSKALLREAEGPALYLIRLQDAPLATYDGKIPALEATSPLATGARKLDASDDASRRYLDYLRQQQDAALSAMEATVGQSLDVVYRYVAANNGFAIRLTPAQAAEIAKLPQVSFVQRDVERELHTDSGPEWIGAFDIWDSAVSGDCVDNCGEGIIVGVIDTGINPSNPSFADIGGDGYDHTNPFGAGNYVGVCDPGDPTFDATFPCNDKLIGARGYATVNSGDPRDYDSHGSHTASTAAGNFVFAAPVSGSGAADNFDISGVAPHANIIAYSACCTLGALTASIDDTVIDGVDVINYSIGSPSASALWSDFDTVGFLAARAAGIFVATSAGNDGPGAATLGSPADAPWLTATAASTHTRSIQNTLINMSGGDTTPPLDIEGKGFTGPLAASPIVYAGDFGDPLCGPGSFAAGTWTGEIVVCDRGTFGRVQKSEVVAAAGAGGYVLANGAADAATLNGDAFAVPGVHISFADGVVLKTWLASGAGHMAEIDGFGVAFPPDYPDSITSFSSRGPNRAIDLISPSVAAPGLDIIAAVGVGDPLPAEWGIISGTSMASPHVAGAGALMMNEHPSWTPAQIQSALMTTAFTDMVNEDGSTPSGPFDMGSGRVDLAAATDAGLLLDESIANYNAADPDIGGDPKDLNVASMADSQCLGVCSFTRTVENVTGGSEEWTASTSGDPAITVTPSVFTIADGATQAIDFDVDVSGLPFDVWSFGEVVLTPTGAGPDIKLPVAVIPSAGVFPERVDVATRRNAGSQAIEDIAAIEITDLTLEVAGLTQGTQEALSLSQDPTNGDPYDNLDDGTTKSVAVSVPAGAVRLVAQTFDSTAPDMDLFVGTGTTPSAATQVCSSTSPTAVEYCNIADPAAGDWWILVQNWDESAAPPDTATLDWAVVAGDAGNLTVTGPAAVAAGTPFDLTLAFNEPGLEDGDMWYAAFSMGSSAATPGDVGTIEIDLERHGDDVTKTVTPDSGDVGDTLTYTVTVEANVTPVDQDYLITDTIPEGMTYVAGSATNGATHSNGVITWSGTQVVPASEYEMSTPATNPNCDTGFGGYLDLEIAGPGFPTNPGITGDTTVFTAFAGQDGIDFYGDDYAAISFTDDGFVIFDAPNNYGGAPWIPQSLPDADVPNNVAALLWQDFELFYDLATNQGVTLVTAGTPVSIIEYDNMEFFGGSPPVLDMEIVIWGVVDPTFPEIIFAYDNIDVGLIDFIGGGTIGVENAAGDAATALANAEPVAGLIADGDQICFDLVPSGNPVSFSYDVTVDAFAQGPTLTNEVTSIVTNDAASMEETASADFTLNNSAPVAVADAYSVKKGGTLFQNGVLANDTDVDGDSLTAIKSSSPAHGTLFFGADGTFVYVHDGSAATSDTFRYKANDGDLNSKEATVTITITPEALPPAPTPVHNVGLVDPARGEWTLRKSNGTEMSIMFGNPGDHPVVGDWDGDGDETPGVWRPPTGTGAGHFYGTNALATGVAQVDFALGLAGDIILAGDWNGDGKDTVGLYRPSDGTVRLWNTMAGGAPDVAYGFGNPGDAAFAGDFDGNGTETIGLHRVSTGQVFLKNAHSEGPGDITLVFGDPADKMLAGDWTGNGIDTVGLYRDSNGRFYMRNTNTTGVADGSFLFGSAGSGMHPVAGEMGI
jgi:uncharacterized repeat protein (TIGR01451 family)